ncbi:MAG: 6-pyruvoyl-tetrahydropterin synthase-related protein, partial [Clostridia bacterium]|nr:6-pyruvoyl-tetrahydropterin synthase-related protein [Clostridia bacterium]
MRTQEYRFKFYLNATHYVNLNTSSKVHPHTWEIVLFIRKTEEGFVQFTQLEATLKKYLVLYEGKYLNAVHPFQAIEPTLENIGVVFFDSIKAILEPTGWELQRLEISENPSRTFIISSLESLLEHDFKGGRNASAYEQMSFFGFDKALQEAASTTQASASTQGHGNVQDMPVKVQDELLGDIEAVDEAPRKGSMADFALKLSEQFEAERLTKRYSLEGQNASGLLSGGSKPKPLTVVFGFILVVIAALATVAWIMRSGLYPWGSDSWYHLFKADLLYHQIQKGNFFPLYTGLWYNGIQPLRYWAPLPHYILAMFQFFTGGNIGSAYNAFIAFIFVLGATGWLLWGYRTRRFGLGLALALLWFYLPDNVRVLFSEGNLSRVTVTALFPFLLLAVWTYLEKRNRKSLIGIALSMTAITFCHAMIAAMVGICLFLFISFYCLFTKKPREFLESLAAAVTGILIAGVWLYPALKGGLVSMDSGAVSEL